MLRSLVARRRRRSAAWAARRLYEALRRRAGAARATRPGVLVGDAGGARRSLPAGSAAARDLAEAINGLAASSGALARTTWRGWWRRPAARWRSERDQLGALMAELDQSVVVCNLDGRILLYNDRARALFRRLSRAAGSAGGAELIGLGRSIHARHRPRADRPRARDASSSASPRGAAAASAQFVTTHARRPPAARAAWRRCVRGERRRAALTGFVLLLDDITDDYETQSRRDQQLLELTEAQPRLARQHAGGARRCSTTPTSSRAERERFQRGGARRGRRHERAPRRRSPPTPPQDLMTRWPLQDMLGADLVTAAAQRRIEADARPAGRADRGRRRPLWLSVDSFALHPGAGLPRRPACRTSPAARPAPAPRRAGGRAHLDLVWPGQAPAPRP